MAVKYYIGLDIGGTNIKAALVRNKKITERIKLPTKSEQGFESSFSQILQAIDLLIKKVQIEAIGIGIAGLIDPQKKLVRFSPNLPGWNDIYLGRLLEKAYKVPVFMINDVDAICLGEWRYGAGRAYKNVFLFTLGTGVGGAAICEGKPLFGKHGFAGEFGHSVIKFNGRRCKCGNRGCLEQYVGARQIVQLAKSMMKKKKSALHKYKRLTPHIIADQAKKGDQVAKEVFLKIAFYIGIGLSNIVALFDPAVIIISGGISRSGRILFDPIKKTVAQRVMGAQFRQYRIVPPELGDDAGILGAVCYARGLFL